MAFSTPDFIAIIFQKLPESFDDIQEEAFDSYRPNGLKIKLQNKI